MGIGLGRDRKGHEQRGGYKESDSHSRNMTGFRVVSTLLAMGLGCATVGAAQAPASDTMATRSMWAAYVGYAEGSQFVAGAQLHLRTPIQPLLLVPEAAIAHGASLLAGVGAHLSPLRSKLRPYAGLSLGYLWEGSDDDATNAFVLTPKAGLLLNNDKLPLMLEYQGVDWFHQYRVLLGLSWRL